MITWLLARLWRGAGRLQWVLGLVLVSTVGLATMTVLLLASIPAAMERQESRVAWTQLADWTAQGDPAVDENLVYVHPIVDRVHGQDVTVVNVAVLGRGVMPPAGIERFPEPGQVLLSPALDQVLTSTPEAGSRYGEPVGLVGPQSLAGPEHLLAVRGVTADQLSPIAVPLRELADRPPSGTGTTLGLLLALAGIAMLLPPLLLAYTATRVAARTRQRRTAHLVIAGVPRRLLNQLVLWETVVGALGGVLAGALAFVLARPVFAPLIGDGPAPYASDLVPPFALLLVIVILLPALVGVIGLRSARASLRDPLRSAVTARERRGTPLAAATGIAAVIGAAGLGLSGSFTGTRGTLLVMGLGAAGLVLVAPAVCRAAGKVLLRSSRPETMLAGAAISSSPRAAARAVLAAMLAVFISTIFVVTNPAAVASAPPDPVIDQSPSVMQVESRATTMEELDQLASRVRDLDDVTDATTILTGSVQTGSDSLTTWIGDCEAIARAADIGSLTCSADHAMWMTEQAASMLPPEAPGEISNLAPRTLFSALAMGDPDAPSTLPLPDTPAGQLDTSAGAVDRPQVIVDARRSGLDLSPFRATLLVVRVQDPAAFDLVRELTLQSDPTADVATRETSQRAFDGDLARYYTVMIWGAGATFIIAATGLFTASLASMVEGARTNAVLHAVGTTHATLRRVVVLVTMTPLLLLSAVGLVLGLLCGLVVLGATQNPSWTGISGLWPVLAGVVAATLIGSSAALFVSSTTSVEHVHGE